jgi:hypothetical protein
VYVSPWVGYVEPARPPTSVWAGTSFVSCPAFLAIGVRGSGESPQGDPPSYSGPADGFGARTGNAYNGFKNYLTSHGYSGTDFESLGLRYRALGVAFNPFNFGTQGYFDSIFEGVDRLISELYAQRSRCPSQRVLLTGYSQGALVIHLALRLLETSDSSMLSASRIAGVMLIADPAKTPNGNETIWEGENDEAADGSGIDGADGIWNKSRLPNRGPIPSAIVGRTISFCFQQDIVCAPGSRANMVTHTSSYTSSAMNAMGTWMAKRVLGTG